MSIETQVADHYTTGGLTDRIMAALGELGVDIDQPQPEDLKPVDEFHTGGLEATQHLLGQLQIGTDTKVLDIGCGIGGTARQIAREFRARAHGIDLTPEYVQTAQDLSAKVGLSELTRFEQASAVDLPKDAKNYDLATMFHVGMNILDKNALFKGVAVALKPGGRFALFDVMKTGDAPLAFPLPWSSVVETSFVDPPQTYQNAAAAAGFTLDVQTDRTAFAKDFFVRVAAKIAADGPPPLGIHLLMGETAAQKIENYVKNLTAGRIAPTEMIFRKT